MQMEFLGNDGLGVTLQITFPAAKLFTLAFSEAQLYTKNYNSFPFPDPSNISRSPSHATSIRSAPLKKLFFLLRHPQWTTFVVVRPTDMMLVIHFLMINGVT